MMTTEQLIADGYDAPQILASHLIDVWCGEHEGKIPWEKAVAITALMCKMPDAERDRLLSLGVEGPSLCDLLEQFIDLCPRVSDDDPVGPALADLCRLAKNAVAQFA